MTDENKKVRVRFAPSPPAACMWAAHERPSTTGRSRAPGRDFILRIEDTDPERSTEENVQVILNAMKWLGLDWDEGPEVGGAANPTSKRNALDTYAAGARADEAARQRVSLLLHEGRA